MMKLLKLEACTISRSGWNCGSRIIQRYDFKSDTQVSFLIGDPDAFGCNSCARGTQVARSLTFSYSLSLSLNSSPRKTS